MECTMAIDAEREFGYMYDKLDYYGQKRWLNVILPAWEGAYRTAYGRVAKAVEKKAAEAFDVVDTLGVIVGQGSLGLQLPPTPSRLRPAAGLPAHSQRSAADRVRCPQRRVHGRALLGAVRQQRQRGPHISSPARARNSFRPRSDRARPDPVPEPVPKAAAAETAASSPAVAMVHAFQRQRS